MAYDVGVNAWHVRSAPGENIEVTGKKVDHFAFFIWGQACPDFEYFAWILRVYRDCNYIFFRFRRGEFWVPGPGVMP